MVKVPRKFLEESIEILLENIEINFKYNTNLSYEEFCKNKNKQTTADINQ